MSWVLAARVKEMIVELLHRARSREEVPPIGIPEMTRKCLNGLSFGASGGCGAVSWTASNDRRDVRESGTCQSVP
jgi:hypothetical protein